MIGHLARVRAYWLGRPGRERIFLAVGAAVLALALVYALLVEPLLQANRKLAASLPQQRAELRLMRAQTAEIERLRGQGRTAAPAGTALLHAIEAAAAAHGAREGLSHLAPLARDRVQASTGPMPVGVWLAWFTDLEQRGIAVETCRLTTDGGGGLVSVEAILTGGGG